MSAIALLMGLLVLSYLGTLLVGSGKSRGSASGIEFIGLGFIVGPQALGLVERPMISEFGPVIDVALGWLAFIIGLDFGRIEGGRRVSMRATALGVGGALITGVLVTAAVWQLLAQLTIPGIHGPSAMLLAAGAGAVAAETSGYGVQWVQTRWGAKGPIARLLKDMGTADDLAPLVAVGAIFALAPPTAGLTITLPPWGVFAASILLGALLGLITAMLLRGAEGDAVWAALIGTILLVTGVAARFGLCTIFVTFVMGTFLAAGSPSRRALRRMVGPTERAILYPMLLLAGARLDPRPLLETKNLAVAVALVLLARVVGKLLSGLLVRIVHPAARPAGPLLGIVLLSSGPVSTSCGLVFALRFPGAVGDTLLVCAAASAVLGELVSTLALRGLLTEAGEIAATSPPKPQSVPPASPLSTEPSLRAGGSVPPPALESTLSLDDIEPTGERPVAKQE